LGAAGYISSADAFKVLRQGIEDKSLQLFVPNSKRLRGYTRWVHFFKKCTPLEDLKKRYMVSLKKALGRHLFLLGKSWRNKKRLSSSTIQCSGACPCVVPRVPRKEGRRSSPTRILNM
jgi:hypothetical protein